MSTFFVVRARLKCVIGRSPARVSTASGHRFGKSATALRRATDAAGCPRPYAVGDTAAHRLEQGGLAAQQAAVAASVIAAAAGVSVPPRPYRPLLRWPPLEIAGRRLAPYLAAQPELAPPVRPAPVIPLAVAAR